MYKELTTPAFWQLVYSGIDTNGHPIIVRDAIFDGGLAQVTPFAPYQKPCKKGGTPIK